MRDAYDTGVAGTGLDLPSGKYEVELTIQDRQFDTNGQWFFPAGEPEGLNGTPPNPETHPFWLPEFFGDAIVVNGKTWPYLNVEPRRYRFRILNACNARFLQLGIVPGASASARSDDLADRHRWRTARPAGPDKRPREKGKGLLLAPAERADVIIDFAGFAARGCLLLNSANAPYPSGDAPDPETNGQVMQFRVELARQGRDTSFDPAAARAALRGGKHRAARHRPPDIARPRHSRGWGDDFETPAAHLGRGRRRRRPASGLDQQHPMGNRRPRSCRRSARPSFGKLSI